MVPKISVGVQDFEFIRRKHCFFVDKTYFIKEWWENQDIVTLITRPRRFGKTLNLNMLECFFSTEYSGREDLFEGLSIWNEEEYRKLQGSYPVIFLSFASVKGNTYETTREGILQLLTKLYSRHSYLREAPFMTRQDIDFFDSVSVRMTDAAAAFSVHSLSDYMSRYYGKKVLIFLDEYDTPLQEAYVHGYWDEMAGFMRSLFNAAFKTNPYMERSLMTGITRVSKESIFSDLNNLEIVTTTSEKYEDSFGFTQEEVEKALVQYGLSKEADKVRAWYDGFAFGRRSGIYNPWSIINFLDKRKAVSYWANSSSNALADNLIRQGRPEIKIAMEDLLAGKELVTELEEEIIFDQLTKRHGVIWSLLLASGYLKVEEKTFCEDTGRTVYHLRLTNREVTLMFENMIKNWFAADSVPYSEFQRALLAGDVDYMNVYMNQVAAQTFSFFDTGNVPSENVSPERFYHGFVLGLIVELAGRYRITSNRESGLGRYDVMLEPLKPHDLAMILEFKVRNPRKEKTLEDTLAAALAQIGNRGYDTELTSRGILRENIRHYGFAFEGKTVLIG